MDRRDESQNLTKCLRLVLIVLLVLPAFGSSDLSEQKLLSGVDRQSSDSACPTDFFEDTNLTIFDYLEDLSKNAQTSVDSYAVFLRLLKSAGLKQALNDASKDLTVFATNDLGTNASAIDISREFNITYSPDDEDSLNIAKVYQFLGVKFPRLFNDPCETVRLMMRHHIIGERIKPCAIYETSSWTTWANQPVNISGSRLDTGVRDTSSNIQAPQLLLQYYPIRAPNGVIHIIDRMVFIDLSQLERSSPEASRAPVSSNGNVCQRLDGTPSEIPEPSGPAVVPFSESSSPSSPVSTSPSPEATVGGDSKGQSRVCFPASAEVYLKHGVIPITDVNVGTKVRDKIDNLHETNVILLTHGKRKWTSQRYFKFVEIKTDDYQLRLSSTHILPVNATFVEAGQVHCGDSVETILGLQVVRSIKEVWDFGLYNPQTNSGSMIVNGILVSCYTSAVKPTSAHAFLAPLRALALMHYHFAAHLLSLLSSAF